MKTTGSQPVLNIKIDSTNTIPQPTKNSNQHDNKLSPLP